MAPSLLDIGAALSFLVLTQQFLPSFMFMPFLLLIFRVLPTRIFWPRYSWKLMPYVHELLFLCIYCLLVTVVLSKMYVLPVSRLRHHRPPRLLPVHLPAATTTRSSLASASLPSTSSSGSGRLCHQMLPGCPRVATTSEIPALRAT